jgi:hypothetical protein
MGDRSWRSLLDALDQMVRDHLRRFRGREINTTGDGFVASIDGSERPIRCPQAIVCATKTLGIELRVGVHTGGGEMRGQDLGGLAVHIAAGRGDGRLGRRARVGNGQGPGVVGSGIEFDDQGVRELKGVPGTWKLSPSRANRSETRGVYPSRSGVRSDAEGGQPPDGLPPKPWRLLDWSDSMTSARTPVPPDRFEDLRSEPGRRFHAASAALAVRSMSSAS